MRPRLYLISIIVAIVISLLTYGKLDIFQETRINFLNKELILNSEIVLSLIVLTTLLFVLAIGLIDKLFTTKKPKKIVKIKNIIEILLLYFINSKSCINFNQTMI